MLKKSLLALAISSAVLLAGCGSDGDDGATGAAGPVGAQGTQGQQGEPGTSVLRDLSIEVVGRFASGVYGKSAAEIVQFHKTSQSVFAVNGASNQIEVISLANIGNTAVANPVSDDSLSAVAFTFPSTVEVMGDSGSMQMTLGDANSIAVFGDMLAIAVAGESKTDDGAVLFFSLDDTGAGSFVKAVKAGALPDMVTFNHAGDKVLVANEGEPSKDFATDPEGSISVIAIVEGVPADMAMTINLTDNMTFSSDLLSAEDYDTDEERRELLIAEKVKFASVAGTRVAQDLEPEYIAVAADDSKAYVSLQENNAMGIIDLNNMTIEVRGLGYKDWSDYKLDYTNKDEVAVLKSVDQLYGLYQPDSIATFEYNGATFVLSANEGDAREYIYSADEATCTAAGHEFDDGDCIAYNEEVRLKDLEDDLTANAEAIYNAHGGKDGLGRLKATNVLGKVDSDNDGVADKYDAFYAYGARSFSIWDQNANLVYDSGDDFERITAALLGSDFNSAHTENKGDNRSDDKGGEPEAITVGMVGDRQYAFIGLERSGDMFAYDVTNPFNPAFVAHYNNRDFTTSFELDDDLDNPCDTAEGMDCSDVGVSGDLGPESIAFVSAVDSPSGEALLIVGNEVSGSVTVYQVKQQ